MSSLFDDLKQGLEEAIAYEKGTGDAKVKTYKGVSPKTVEAWEHGTTHPSGSAFRLMGLLASREIEDIEYVIAKLQIS